MMNDDALAPVIAVMLILAIGVTVFAVYTSTYLPGLKQQDEVDHLQQVESGFVKFSSDIDNVMYTKNVGQLTEQIPLGGGDILINSLKSSGTVRIQEEQYPYLIIRNESGEQFPMYIVNYSYNPIGNFWVDQGYTWQDGYVNVTKGTRSTSLQGCTMEESESKMENFAKALISKPGFDGKNITLDIVSFSNGGKSISSGNGISQLTLNATRSNPVRYLNSTSFSFIINRTSPMNETIYNYLVNELNGLSGIAVSLPIETEQSMEIDVTVLNTPANIIINEFQIALETQ
jgi:hypothetical protein